MSEVDVRIRRANSVADIQSCIDLQREVWRFTEPEDIAARPLLILGNRYGGSVLLAECSDGQVVGFSYAFLCRDGAAGLFWWSHMTAVSPQHQGRTIGFKLKLAQREAALDEGIDRIRWTFDPLQALNAHFNIRKLGVTVVDYETNIYGQSSSPLHHGMPTDRLLVEWNLRSPAVADRLGGNPPVILRDFDGLVRILAGNGDLPSRPALDLDESPLALEIPSDIRETPPESLRAWQKTLETAFRRYFGLGYTITDFLTIDHPRAEALYVMEKRSGPGE